MSKPIKEMIKAELLGKFQGVTSVAICEFTGVDAVSTNKIRGQLLEKDIRVAVVKNSLARRAFREVGLEAVATVLQGPCAVVYGADSVVTIVRELLDLKKTTPALTVKAAVLDGEVFPAERIEELSKYPNRAEAIAKAVGAVLSAGGNLVGAVTGPGGALAGILKTIQENQGGGQEAA